MAAYLDPQPDSFPTWPDGLPRSSAHDRAGAPDARSSPASMDLQGDVDARAIELGVMQVLRTIYDPEIPVDIFDLGLIYGIDVNPGGLVTIRMTLTAPGCPVAGSLPLEVEEKVAGVSGVSGVRVELVWEPPWSLERASEAARLTLGL